MSDNQTPPNPQLSGDEPSLGSETPHLTGREPGLGGGPRTLAGLPAMAQARMAETLARTGSPAARRFLLQALLEGDENVSQAAAQILGRIKDPFALDALAEASGNTDLEPPIRAAALKAVGQIGGRKGLSILLDAENDPDPTVREARVRALGNLGARLEGEDSQLLTHILEALSTAFYDLDPTVREVSVVMVGWVGGEEAHAILLRALYNPRLEVRRAAYRLLPPDFERQEHHTYLQNLRHYRSTLQQAYQLAAWLVRNAGGPTLIQTLTLAVIVGLELYFIYWPPVWFRALPVQIQNLRELFAILFAIMFLVGVVCIPLWLVFGTFKATDKYRLNEQFAIIRITELNRSVLLISYILANFHRTRVVFALMTSVLVTWLVAAHKLHLLAVVFLSYGACFLLVPLSVVYALAPRRIVRHGNFTVVEALLFVFGIVFGIFLLSFWSVFTTLPSWVTSSLIRSLALLSICIVIALAVIVSLFNRFKRWS